MTPQAEPLSGPILAASATTAGRRDTNQDRVCVERTTVGPLTAVVAAVADGMGGMQSGDRAAELAIESVRSFARDLLPLLPDERTEVRRALKAMFQRANQQVFAFGQQAGAAGEVGTTLVCAVVTPRWFLIAHAGDSRCYYLSNHAAHLLTDDHSAVQEAVRAGAMTADAARQSPLRNQLTNSLGEPHELQVDLVPAGAHVGVIDEPCALLLCSDGLHGEVSESDLFDQLHGTATPDAACTNLLSLAVQRGSTDNVSLVLVETGPLARRRPRTTVLPSPAQLLQHRSHTPPPRRSRGAKARVLTAALLVGTAWAAIQTRMLPAVPIAEFGAGQPSSATPVPAPICTLQEPVAGGQERVIVCATRAIDTAHAGVIQISSTPQFLDSDLLVVCAVSSPCRWVIDRDRESTAWARSVVDDQPSAPFDLSAWLEGNAR